MNNIKILPSLLIFADVAKYKSFTKAAAQNNMSKSAVSQQIKKLESDIGQQLLSRHTRGMSLTSTGSKLLAHCELLKDQVDELFEHVQANKEAPSGVFAITIPHSFEKSIAIPALSQLCIEYPLIQPKLIVTDEPLDLIEDKLDVSIYGGELKDSNYRALPLGSVSEVLCASPSFVLRHGDIKHITQLPDHRFIRTPWQNNPIQLYKKNRHHEAISLEIPLNCQTNTLPSAIEMIAHDMGIGLLPKFCLKEKRLNNSIKLLLPDYEGKQWPFYYVHRFQKDKPVHIDRFYQLVKHFLEKEI